MQRVDNKSLAHFQFNAAGIKHIKDDLVLDDSVHINGEALSAILLTNMKLADGKEMPDIPELEEVDDQADFSDDTEFTISGYP